MSFTIKRKDIKKHKKVAKWYDEYLQSESWIKTRTRVMDRAKGRCERCDIGWAIAVHHKTYERVTKEWLRDLQALCADCHFIVHDKTLIPFAERIYDKDWLDTYRRIMKFEKG